MQALASRRNRLEVLTEILRFCKSPRGKTRIMQKANLSHHVLQECLQQLQGFDLVEVRPKTFDYVTTKKGTIFLEKWGQLEEFLMPEETITIKAKRFLHRF